MAQDKRYIYRDAVTGKLVTEQYAKDNPGSTVCETVKLEPKEPEPDEK